MRTASADKRTDFISGHRISSSSHGIKINAHTRKNVVMCERVHVPLSSALITVMLIVPLVIPAGSKPALVENINGVCAM